MDFDFASCFWDPHDDGVNILLQHISDGIKSISTLEQFFRSKAEIAKDYSRRYGAVNEKLKKDISKYPDFGRLNDVFFSLSSIERARAAAFSKQCEMIHNNLYQQTKLFGDNMRASYTTISGKIENLRKDKSVKRKGCEDLAKRLKEAEIKYREYKLNEDNIIGSKRTEQNKREIIKWETNVREISTQLSVLKQEYKASKRFWLGEWESISKQLQNMEYERISFIQSKLQEFISISMETCVLEQTKLDFLNNELTTFTAWDDIKKFSSEFGTGRLKQKNKSTSTRPASYASSLNTTDLNINSNSNTDENMRATLSKRESYMEDIRKLSNQFQKTHLSRNINSFNKSQQNFSQFPKTETTSKNSVPHMDYITNSDEKTLPVIKQRAKGKFNRYSLHESHLPSYSNANKDISTFSMEKIIGPTKDVSKQDYSYKNDENDSAFQHNKAGSQASTTSTSSNPTDFSSQINRRRSAESISTSVTSIASSIDDNQRFAKSWNSTQNRKRKSMSHISSDLNDSTETNTHYLSNKYHENTNNTKSQLYGSTRSYPNETRQNSTSTILMKSLDTPKSTRRKSLVKDPSSNDPIEDAILEMNRIQSGITRDKRMGRVNDNGIIVTLPLVTRSGTPVIKYAKALYPLLNNHSPEVINFDKNDYLLITEEINGEWYLGEVYDNDKIHPAHRVGLIPYNFIKILD